VWREYACAFARVDVHVSGGAPPQCNLTHNALVLFLEALSRKLVYFGTTL
jgi:hypothetical protein